ncbi:hypothetical protein VOWphi5012_006 [Vibrio phage phi50-12]|uniref:Uncharacterized protein n=1 Tax=Vibrio phage phi50-12 TaxID=2654972 RepID=A0A5P8PR69_9CAUD|nr:hypothetical protein KNU82_gp006 [Vibrio phage phi50-12]QFR59790.1 hypothetical protein VOWphi5012_006 [Vibrio phage phi50-12]
MKIKCKKTLILKPTNIEAITAGVEYEVANKDEWGTLIINNEGVKHHFDDVDLAIYFE